MCIPAGSACTHGPSPPAVREVIGWPGHSCMAPLHAAPHSSTPSFPAWRICCGWVCCPGPTSNIELDWPASVMQNIAAATSPKCCLSFLADIAQALKLLSSRLTTTQIALVECAVSAPPLLVTGIDVLKVSNFKNIEYIRFVITMPLSSPPGLN